MNIYLFATSTFFNKMSKNQVEQRPKSKKLRYIGLVIVLVLIIGTVLLVLWKVGFLFKPPASNNLSIKMAISNVDRTAGIPHRRKRASTTYLISQAPPPTQSSSYAFAKIDGMKIFLVGVSAQTDTSGGAGGTQLYSYCNGPDCGIGGGLPVLLGTEAGIIPQNIIANAPAAALGNNYTQYQFLLLIAHFLDW